MKKRTAQNLGLLLSILTLLTFCFGLIAKAEAEQFLGYTEVEDSKTALDGELFTIKYNGTWGGEGAEYPVFHGGTEHYASIEDSFEMNFIGNKFEIIATKAPNHGNYTVWIDGVKMEEKAHGLGDTRTHQQVIYTSPKLEDSQHHLKVQLLEGDGQNIQLDYIKVYHQPLQVSELRFNQKQVVASAGETIRLEYRTIPWNATLDQEVLWTSSHEDIATVDHGLVTVKNVDRRAEVDITMSLANNPHVFDTVKLVVAPAMKDLGALVLDEKKLDTQDDYTTIKNLFLAGQNNNFNAVAWRSDVINSKLGVLSNDKPISDLHLGATDFTDENGNVISKNCVEITWLKEIEANIGRGNPSAPVKKFPDIIHNNKNLTLAAYQLAFAWVQINVPSDAKAGTYHGKISLSTADQEHGYTFNYTVEVLDLDLPSLEHSNVQLWQHPFSVANYYLGLGKSPSGGITDDVDRDFYFTDKHFDLMRQAMKEYARIGGRDAVANIVEEAWGHQSYYNDLSMVRWIKNADGTFSYDYEWYDRWIQFMIECGIIDPQNNVGKIKCYSIVPWENQITYWDQSTSTNQTVRYAPGTDKWNQLWKDFLEDFMKHSKEKGWFDVTYISMDERSLDQLKPAVEIIESVKDENGKSFKVASALNFSAPEQYSFTDRIHDISINLGNAANVEQIRNLARHRRNLGLVTTFYTCTGDYPSNFVISDPGDNYWDMLYTLTLDVDGYLRWALDNYVYDMHRNVSYRYWEPGDGWFIYPLERDVPFDVSQGFYSTPRFELFKQGVRDVAKIRQILNSDLLSEKEKEEYRAKVTHMIVPNSTTSYGSRVYASEEDRALVHNETSAVMDETAEIARLLISRAREAADTILVDKTQLQSRYDEAKKLKEGAYTKDSIGILNAAMEQAHNVLKDPNATQADVDKAFEDLKNTMENLELKPDENPVLPMDPTSTPDSSPSVSVDSTSTPDSADSTPEPTKLMVKLVDQRSSGKVRQTDSKVPATGEKISPSLYVKLVIFAITSLALSSKLNSDKSNRSQ